MITKSLIDTVAAKMQWRIYWHESNERRGFFWLNPSDIETLLAGEDHLTGEGLRVLLERALESGWTIEYGPSMDDDGIDDVYLISDGRYSIEGDTLDEAVLLAVAGMEG